AQLGTPDMRIPIQYALSYPERLPSANGKRLDLATIGKLHFQKMDFERFKCLHFAYEVGKAGGSLPTVLNAANEVAVQKFLNREISFLQIEDLIEKALNSHQNILNPSLEVIQEVDLETRKRVSTLL
ncbi:MAG: 1-deoxy-D-xylulose-5-phosphate reductoisomerase, partial [Niallia sp.]